MSPMVAARITNKFKAPIPLTDREGWFYMGDNASDPEARLFAGIGAVLIHTDRGQYLKLVSKEIVQSRLEVCFSPKSPTPPRCRRCTACTQHSNTCHSH